MKFLYEYETGKSRLTQASKDFLGLVNDPYWEDLSKADQRKLVTELKSASLYPQLVEVHSEF